MRYNLLALLITLLPATLAAQSVEERLAKLEAEVRELREENRALRQQLSVPPPAVTQVAVTPATVTAAKPAAPAPPKVTVGGFVQAQGEAGGRIGSRFSDDNDRVFLRRARLNAQGKFAEHFDFKLELDLAGSLGATSALRAQMTDGFITWTQHPAASVKVGQFKTPFGFEQLYSDQRLPTPERSLGTDRLAVGRQLGVQLFGELAKKRFTYALGGFNGNGANNSFNDDEGFLTVGRVTGKLYDTKKVRWTAGAGAFRGDDRAVTVAPELGFANNTFAGKRHGWGVDTQIVAGRVEVWLETLRTTHDPLSGLTRDSRSLAVQGTYFLTKKLQAVGRWDSFEPTADGDDLTAWLLGGTYLIRGDELKLQLNFVRGEHDDRVIARVQTVF